MKTRHWILAVIAALLLGLFLWWSRDRHQAASGEAKPTVATNHSSSDVAGKEAVPVKPAVTPANTALPSQPPSRGEKMRTILQEYNHKDIEFYGKVIDQHGAPLPGVQVNGQVIYNSGFSSGVLKRLTYTDANGYFEIKDIQGRTLDFNLIKEGYQFMPEGDAFDYTELVSEEKRHHPDPKNPVVLRMWKLQGAEPMVHFERRGFKLTPDGTPLRIELATGKAVETGGDLIIVLKHPVAETGRRLEQYPWSAELLAPGGGLVGSTARLMYLAPESGYVEKITLGETGREPKIYDRPEFFVGGGGAYQQYYVKTGDGRYARVVIDIGTDTSPERGSHVGVKWWLNPKPGSRNLEFDSAKIIKIETR
jgi:hypothetical protein